MLKIEWMAILKINCINKRYLNYLMSNLLPINFIMKIKNVLLLLFFVCVGLFANAQTKSELKKEKISELKEVFKTSLFESEVEIEDNGNVFRVDNTGNTFKFSLKDIKEVNSDFDGFYNLLIIFKDKNSSLVTIDGVESRFGMNVFAFEDSADCEKAKKLLSEIISK
jgi:phage pi2 protein 07